MLWTYQLHLSSLTDELRTRRHDRHIPAAMHRYPLRDRRCRYCTRAADGPCYTHCRWHCIRDLTRFVVDLTGYSARCARHNNTLIAPDDHTRHMLRVSLRCRRGAL